MRKFVFAAFATIAFCVPVLTFAAPSYNVTGPWVIAFEYLGTPYAHDMTLAQDGAGNITGSGGHPAGGAHVYTWVIDSGTVDGNTFNFIAHYTASADAVIPLTVMQVTGTIAGDGTMSGTWADNYQGGSRGGTWTSTSGVAAPIVTTNVEVSGNTSTGENQPGWMFGRDLANATPIEFNTDEASVGEGSLYVLPIGATAAHKFIGENFINTPITNVNSISYDFKIASTSLATQEEHFYMNVYANFGVSDDLKFYDCRYDIVPTVGSTAGFTTVIFDPSLAYPVTTRGGANASPYVCPTIPADMDLQSPGSNIRAFALNVGDTSTNDVGLSGYLDNVVTNLDSGITIYDFEPAGTLVAEDFGVVNYDTGLGILKGYTAGFGLLDNTFAGATSVVVQLFAAANVLLQTNTAIFPKFNDDITGTQFSSPFDVSGSFDYVTDGYWTNVRESQFGQSIPATKVVATVTLANGKVVTAENSLLTGDPTIVFYATVPTEKSQCMNNGWKTLKDAGVGGKSFKNQGDCVSFVATKGKNTGVGN